MYPIQHQVPLTSNVLAYQKELHRQTQQNSLQRLARRRKFSFLKLALPIADIMINTGEQIKARYQPA